VSDAAKNGRTREAERPNVCVELLLVIENACELFEFKRAEKGKKKV